MTGETEQEEEHAHVHREVDDVAKSFFAEEAAVDAEGEALDAEMDAQVEANITEKIRFFWRAEDDLILPRVDALAQSKFIEDFAPAIREVDRFYEALRVPKVNDFGVVIPGQWETDEHGQFIERWSQLDGQTIEQCIMNLMRIKMYIAREVTKLRNQAVYAKMAADDVKDEVWPTVKGGTVGDKTSKANRRSRQDRYHAYFTYVLWSQADTFQREIVDFMFRLRDVRNWRIQAQPR